MIFFKYKTYYRVIFDDLYRIVLDVNSTYQAYAYKNHEHFYTFESYKKIKFYVL